MRASRFVVGWRRRRSGDSARSRSLRSSCDGFVLRRTLTVLAFDFRPGRVCRCAYDVPGGQRMIVVGNERTMERPSRIVFSRLIEPPDEPARILSEATVTVIAVGSVTELTICHTKLGRSEADLRHEEGWRGALGLLGAELREGC